MLPRQDASAHLPRKSHSPEFHYHLCDLWQYADANLTGTAFGLLLMKYIFRHWELNARLEEFLALYHPLFSGSRWDFFWIAAKYLISAAQGLRPGRLQYWISRRRKI